MYSFLSAYTERIVLSLGFSIVVIGFSYMERMIQTKWWHPTCLNLQGTDLRCFSIHPCLVFFILYFLVCSVFKKYSLSLTTGYIPKISGWLTLSDCASTYNLLYVCDKSASSWILVFLCSFVINHNFSLPEANRGSPCPQSSVTVKNKTANLWRKSFPHESRPDGRKVRVGLTNCTHQC